MSMAKEQQKEDINKEVKTNEVVANIATTVNFYSWFSYLIEKKKNVKANHMSAIKAHFNSLGLSDNESAKEFETALKHYGI